MRSLRFDCSPCRREKACAKQKYQPNRVLKPGKPYSLHERNVYHRAVIPQKIITRMRARLEIDLWKSHNVWVRRRAALWHATVVRDFRPLLPRKFLPNRPGASAD